MSLFSETKIGVPTNETISQIALSHNSVNPTLAVSTSNKIYFFNDAGDKLDIEILRKESPTYLVWHPTMQTLAIGWNNGTKKKKKTNYYKAIAKRNIF
jgi:hypothetical protein